MVRYDLDNVDKAWTIRNGPQRGWRSGERLSKAKVKAAADDF